jgi:predicted AAA+ superfamily ATPase
MEGQDLKAIFVDQQEDALRLRHNWILREKTDELLSLLKSRLIKLIIGIRRSGKSTLCLQPFSAPDFAYANFDDERLISIDAAGLNRVYEVLLQLKPQAKVFIFDEIQNISGWELFVNRLKRKGLNILITGSNGKLLSRELATHLTGRQVSIELFPFSFLEYLRSQSIVITSNRAVLTTEKRAGTIAAFERYFQSGGFPEVVQGEEVGRYLRELFDKIVGRDIVERYKVRDSKRIKELALYLIQSSGSLTSLQKLQRAFSFKSINTVRAYIGYLHDTYILHEVQAYSFKLRERSTLPRKAYACDVGLMTALHTKSTSDLGARLETLIFLHLRRHTSEVYYLKSSKFDIDFCLVTQGKIKTLIQCCYSIEASKTREREINALLAAAQAYGVDDLRIVTWSHREAIKCGQLTIDVVPAWEFCCRPGQ